MSAAAPAPPPAHPSRGPAAAATPAASSVATRTPPPAPATRGTQVSAELPHLAPHNTPTPRLLRLQLTLTTILMVLFGVSAVVMVSETRSAAENATEHTLQLVQIQDIRTEVLRADAAAAQLHLRSDRASAPELTTYRESLDLTRELLVGAAARNPASELEWSRINAELNAYASALERARLATDPAQGQRELMAAQEHLRRTVLPDMDQLSTNAAAQVDLAVGPAPWAISVVLGLLALTALVVTMITTAARFRRVVNPGQWLAIGLLAAGLVISSVSLQRADDTMHGVANDQVSSVTGASKARGLGYEARVEESMVVLTRDPQAAALWRERDSAVGLAFGEITNSQHRRQLTDRWNYYIDARNRVAAEVQKGAWEPARDQVVGTASGTSGAEFENFDHAATEITAQSADSAVRTLRGPHADLLGTVVLVLVSTAGALIALLAGTRARLREYR